MRLYDHVLPHQQHGAEARLRGIISGAGAANAVDMPLTESALRP
jgi:hypothetical protein